MSDLCHVYHVAPATVRAAIAATGLLAATRGPAVERLGQPSGVYVWPTAADAIEYGCTAAIDEPVDVYRIRLGDEALWPDAVLAGALRVDGDVAPERLRLVLSFGPDEADDIYARFVETYGGSRRPEALD